MTDHTIRVGNVEVHKTTTGNGQYTESIHISGSEEDLKAVKAEFGGRFAGTELIVEYAGNDPSRRGGSGRIPSEQKYKDTVSDFRMSVEDRLELLSVDISGVSYQLDS